MQNDLHIARKNRSPKEIAWLEKICELLQIANISSMDHIQILFKETIAEFMENGLEAELDDEPGYRKYDYKNNGTGNRWTTATKHYIPAFGTLKCRLPDVERMNSSPGC